MTKTEIQKKNTETQKVGAKKPAAFSLPEDWKEVTLGEVGKVITGKTPSKNNPEDWGDDVDFITPSDLKTDSKFISKVSRKLSDNGFNRFERMIIPKNSVVVTCIGSDMGKVVLNKNKALTNQQINSLIVSENFDYNFIYYLLKNSYKILRQNAEGGGSTMPILNKTNFENLRFKIPPLPQQKAIAKMLSAFDDKIELLREQNETLEKIGETIFKEYFSLKNPHLNPLPEGEGELPDGWRVGKIGEIVNIKQGKYIKADLLSENKTENKKYPVYGGNGIRGYIEDFVYKKPQVILTCRGNGCGLIQLSDEKSTVTNSCMAFETENSELSTEYVYFWSKRINFESVTSGSAQPQITVTNLYGLEIIIPSDEILEKFNQAVKLLFEKIKNNSEQIQTLAKTRDTLLPKLMKGEIILTEK